MTKGKPRIGKIDQIDDDFDLEDESEIKEEDLMNNESIDLNNDFMSDNSFFGDDYNPTKKNDELLKILTNFDPIIKNSVNSWIGKVWDEEKKQYVYSQELDRKMNEKGAAYYAGYVSTYAKQTNIITNLDDSQSRFIQKEIIEGVFLSMAEKMEDFEIKSSADMIVLANEIIHTAFLVLYGAEAGKYSKLLSETTTRHENISQVNPSYNYPQNKNKTGFFSNLRKGLLGG